MTGKSFHSAKSGSDVRGTEVGVDVLVGTGVIGEYFFGFCVAVGKDADDLPSKSGAGNVWVGAVMGMLRARGVEVVFPVQAVIRPQTIKVRISRRFIKAKYSERKLIGHEILCYKVPHDT